MIRFCYKCGTQIPDLKRIMRGSTYCSPECQRSAAKEKRALLASRYCRLCHRGARRPRVDSKGCAGAAHDDLFNGQLPGIH